MYTNYLALIVLGIILIVFGILQKKKVSFATRSLLSLVVGLLFGLCCKFSSSLASDQSVIMQVLAFIGDLYLNLIKMLVIPLVFTAIVHAVVNMRHQQGEYLTKVAIKIVAILLITTGISAFIAFALGVSLNIGHGFSIPSEIWQPNHVNPGILGTLLEMLPTNPVAIMVNGNVMALVIFALLIGIASLRAYRENKVLAEPFINFIHSAFDVIKKLANMVIGLTPYGVVALIAHTVMLQGVSSLVTMLSFIGVIYLALVLVLIMHTLMLLAVGRNPITYFKAVYRALLVAFTTRSSFGTLPFTMDALRRLGVNDGIANFAPGVGATIGMNACAGVFPAMLVVLTMVASGYPISWEYYIIVPLVSMLASMGVSGIPGTAYIAAGVMLTTLGLPYTYVAWAIAVDAILDMGRTMTNINGVMVAAVVTDATTKVDENPFDVSDDNTLEANLAK
ncbi:dicarboxylate/amino acid:cation symporter [Thiotrichales bacterium 19S3-7]|nr:dicarboxylate/amino acid:cation symporter [Thiotrichales bacterium 19S3-7]MCF6801258.1 dicarboxylate/amino acid:cation symporter [Thiotrichales bacterium 19S3-11]